MRLAVTAVATIMTVSCTQAAEFKLYPTQTGFTLVLMGGEIFQGDFVKFQQITKDIPDNEALIMLSGPGGRTLEGIKFGNYIHQKHWNTQVKMNLQCSSTCGLIWLAGEKRYLGASSKVGFHASYMKYGTDLVEKGSANALVGSYMTRLGLSYEAIEYLTSAPPNGMTWLTEKDAAYFGIPYRQFSDTEKEPSAALDALPKTPINSLGPPKEGLPFRWIR